MHRIFQTSGLSALGLILMGTLHLSACGDDSNDATDPTDEQDAGPDPDDETPPDAGGGDDMDDVMDPDDDTDDAGPDDVDDVDGGATDDAGPGETDGGDAGPAAAQIEQLEETVVTGATDLRGLTYAKNGKIYASGYSDVDASDRQLVIARFNADGSLDADFGDEGVLLHNVVAGDEESLAIVELENGDIIVQANVADGQGGQLVADAAVPPGTPGARPDGKNVVLLRFDDEGELVTSFGTDGMQVVDFGWTDADNAAWPVPGYDSSKEDGSEWTGAGYPEDTAWDVQLDPSAEEETLVVFGYGPAVAGSSRYDHDRYVVRVLAADGSNDPSFNGDGTPFTYGSPGGLKDNARRGIVEADGSIVSSGYANFGDSLGNHVMLIRLKKDGTPDADFGFGIADPGVAKFNPFVDDGGMAEAYAVARQSNGRYVTTGYGNATTPSTPDAPDVVSKYGYATTKDRDLVAFGLTSTGLDLDYGLSGTRAIQSEEYALGDEQDRGRHLAILPDDRSVHVGRFGPNAAIFVVTQDGLLDDSVGTDGRFDYPTFAGSQFFNVAVSPDGTRVAATTTTHADGPGLVLLSVSDE